MPNFQVIKVPAYAGMSSLSLPKDSQILGLWVDPEYPDQASLSVACDPNASPVTRDFVTLYPHQAIYIPEGQRLEYVGVLPGYGSEMYLFERVTA